MRFSIRDVLWLMVVIGLSFGWWLDHRTIAARNDSLWSYLLQRDRHLTDIWFAIQDPFEPGALKKISKILEEHGEASAKPPTPRFRDGKSE
jgi:hypothetical protein